MAEKELAKLCYTANTFIFEETGKKSREKWQSGAELIGMGSPLADVELIALALEVLAKLGLSDIELRLSHAGLTRGILQKLGLNNEEQHHLFDRLLDGDVSVLSQIKIARPELAQLLSLEGKTAGFIRNLASSAALDLPELKPQIDDFAFIADALQSLGCQYLIDIASIRGFEYYTGVIFQIFSRNEKVGGGGRYDALIPAMGAKNTPASGFALYLDVLMKFVVPEKLIPVSLPKIMVQIEPGETALGFGVADRLREAGYTVKFHLGGKGPADTLWKLDVRSRSPRFLLTDIVRNEKFELENSEQILGKTGCPLKLLFQRSSPPGYCRSGQSIRLAIG
jgi:histidyl-tRNA synthetase